MRNRLKLSAVRAEKDVVNRQALFVSLLTVDLVSLVWLVCVLLGSFR